MHLVLLEVPLIPLTIRIGVYPLPVHKVLTELTLVVRLVFKPLNHSGAVLFSLAE